MTKRTVGVTLPITGSVYVEIEVDTETDDDEIFDKACSAAAEDKDREMTWEFTRYVTRGNVCYAECREMDVQDIEGEDDA